MERVALDLRDVSSSHMLGVELLLKRKILSGIYKVNIAHSLGIFIYLAIKREKIEFP